MADQSLQDIAAQAATANGVPVDLFEAQIQQESGFNPYATNGNAQGIAQFMPATAAEQGVSDPYDASAALYGAAAYDAKLYQQTGSWAGAVTSYGTVPSTGAVTAGQQAVMQAAQEADTGMTGSQGLTPDAINALRGAGLTGSDSDVANEFSQYTPEQQSQLAAALQAQGITPYGSNTGSATVNGSATSGISSAATGIGALAGTSASSLIGGGSSTTINTANTGGISGLFTQLETWASDLFLRGSIVLLALILIGVAVMMFKPVQQGAIKIAKVVAA